MKTGNEYRESLRKLNPVIYFMGRKIEDVVEDPATKPHVNAVAQVYDLAFDPAHEDLFITTSHLTNRKIHRFTHIHQSQDDLVNKVRCLRAAGQKTGTCFQRCAGWDALHSMYLMTYEIDKHYQTDYHKRFRKYLEYVQDEDLTVAAGVTDPKGDRSLAASKQADPDLYMRVIKRQDDGIVVRGAKAHQTGAVNAHEILVMPTAALKSGEEDYAVAFAIPIDSKGITQIFGRQTNDMRKEENSFDAGNTKFGVVGGESLIIFDDVFVPWERVFMLGECDMTGYGIEIFACTHRQNYGGCKTGVMDVLIGATSLLTTYQGTKKASHIREKIIEMVLLNETLYGSSLAGGLTSSPTESGAYVVNRLLANITKQNVTRNLYEICRLAHDIAGGILATLPSEKDLNDPRYGHLIEKYMKSVDHYPANDRMKILRLIEAMTGGTALVEAMHGAGSPQAQRVIMQRYAELDAKENLAKKILDIE